MLCSTQGQRNADARPTQFEGFVKGFKALTVAPATGFDAKTRQATDTGGANGSPPCRSGSTEAHYNAIHSNDLSVAGIETATLLDLRPSRGLRPHSFSASQSKMTDAPWVR
jgi:hypothetical protein